MDLNQGLSIEYQYLLYIADILTKIRTMRTTVNSNAIIVTWPSQVIYDFI